MPEIGLANDVTIEYSEDDINIGSGYKFTEDVPELGDFAKRGVRFELKSRRDDAEESGKYLFKFKTNNGTQFQLTEDTFADYLEDGVIANIS